MNASYTAIRQIRRPEGEATAADFDFVTGELPTLADVRDISGPVVVQRYNMYPAAPVNGNPASGISSGQAITLLDAGAFVAGRGVARKISTTWPSGSRTITAR